MKKYILTLALGMACAMGFAQDFIGFTIHINHIHALAQV